MNGGNTSQALKAEIFRRLEAGEKAAHVAREVGVSKQYLSRLNKVSKERGVEATIAGRRGRPKDQELTREETQALCARIVSRRPAEDRLPAHLWRAEEIKSWFSQTYGRRLSGKQLRRVCLDAGLRLARPGKDLSVLYEMEQRKKLFADAKASGAASVDSEMDDADVFAGKRGRRKKSDDFETTRMSDRMMQKIVKANAEAAKVMARARGREADKEAQAQGAAPRAPVRLGPKIGRNDPCPFDPKIKFKRCCGATGAVRCVRQASEQPLEGTQT